MKNELVDWKWNAMVSRNAAFDGVFYFGVTTTGVFCRPSCSSRKPLRKNVRFFLTAEEAEREGFRACLRCTPKLERDAGSSDVLVAAALKKMRNVNTEIATVEELAEGLGVSPGHLQKRFRAVIGLTPKEVMNRMRIENFKSNVKENDVTTSLYESGFGSSRALYEKAGETLGMTPARYKKGGAGIAVRFATADCPLGRLLVAATDRGICAVSFGSSDEELRRELESEFFAAEIHIDEGSLHDAVASILRGMNGERTVLSLPLDVRGTAFQMRVWSELRKIPYGETRTYAEVAEAVGNRNAIRAVARACATNPVAIVTPCHRVIGSDGKLAGYRWGIDRKRELLEAEAAADR